MSQQDLNTALELFSLTRPYTRQQLDQARAKLLHTWNPQRYANLTNNPKKYMQAYKQAEEMTKQVESSYLLLLSTLIPDTLSDDQRSS
jgi:hypothetical protein